MGFVYRQRCATDHAAVSGQLWQVPVVHQAPSRRSVVLLRATRASAGRALSSETGRRRVVITGTGVVTSLGADVDTFYAALLAGQSGIRTIQARPQCLQSANRS